MWLADKQPIQEEIASRLCGLITVFPQTKTSMLFIRMFFRIMLREWFYLDQYRVNKFYMLIRMMFNAALQFVSKEGKWPHRLVDNLVEILENEVLSKTPNGIRFHLADIFLTELFKVTQGCLDTAIFMKLVNPFLECLRLRNHDKALADRICKEVFLRFVTKYAAENEPAAPPVVAGSKASSSSKRQALSLNSRRLLYQEGAGDSADNGATSGGVGEECHTVEVFTSVDTKALQKRVFALASSVDTPEGCRRRLYDLHIQIAAKTGCDFVEADSDEDEDDKEEEASSRQGKRHGGAAISATGSTEMGKKKTQQQQSTTAAATEGTKPKSQSKAQSKSQPPAAVSAAADAPTSTVLATGPAQSIVGATRTRKRASSELSETPSAPAAVTAPTTTTTTAGTTSELEKKKKKKKNSSTTVTTTAASEEKTEAIPAAVPLKSALKRSKDTATSSSNSSTDKRAAPASSGEQEQEQEQGEFLLSKKFNGAKKGYIFQKVSLLYTYRHARMRGCVNLQLTTISRYRCRSSQLT